MLQFNSSKEDFNGSFFKMISDQMTSSKIFVWSKKLVAEYFSLSMFNNDFQHFLKLKSYFDLEYIKWKYPFLFG